MRSRLEMQNLVGWMLSEGPMDLHLTSSERLPNELSEVRTSRTLSEAPRILVTSILWGIHRLVSPKS